MSWGEQSCKLFQNCPEATVKTCNVDCEIYNPVDGIEPTTISKKDDVAKEEPQGLATMSTIKLSDLPKFDKNLEFVVLKKHIFYMQSISPKKIILKFKRKLKSTDTLPDGVYCFHDTAGKEIEFKPVFKAYDISKKKAVK